MSRACRRAARARSPLGSSRATPWRARWALIRQTIVWAARLPAPLAYAPWHCGADAATAEAVGAAKAAGTAPPRPCAARAAHRTTRVGAASWRTRGSIAERFNTRLFGCIARVQAAISPLRNLHSEGRAGAHGFSDLTGRINCMIFTTKAEYGVRLLVELGRQAGDSPIAL